MNLDMATPKSQQGAEMHKLVSIANALLTALVLYQSNQLEHRLTDLEAKMNIVMQLVSVEPKRTPQRYQDQK